MKLVQKKINNRKASKGGKKKCPGATAQKMNEVGRNQPQRTSLVQRILGVACFIQNYHHIKHTPQSPSFIHENHKTNEADAIPTETGQNACKEKQHEAKRSKCE